MLPQLSLRRNDVQLEQFMLNFLLGNVCHISFKCCSFFSGITFYFPSCCYNIIFHLSVRLANLLADSNIHIDVSNDTEFQVVPLCNLLQGIFLHCVAQVTFFFFFIIVFYLLCHRHTWFYSYQLEHFEEQNIPSPVFSHQVESNHLLESVTIDINEVTTNEAELQAIAGITIHNSWCSNISAKLHRSSLKKSQKRKLSCADEFINELKSLCAPMNVPGSFLYKVKFKNQ
jgi:hypothetical protein